MKAIAYFLDWKGKRDPAKKYSSSQNIQCKAARNLILQRSINLF